MFSAKQKIVGAKCRIQLDAIRTSESPIKMFIWKIECGLVGIIDSTGVILAQCED